MPLWRKQTSSRWPDSGERRKLILKEQDHLISSTINSLVFRHELSKWDQYPCFVPLRQCSFFYHMHGVSNLNVWYVGHSDRTNESGCIMSLRASTEFSPEYLFLSLLRVGCQQSGQLMRHLSTASSQPKATCECKINILPLDYGFYRYTCCFRGITHSALLNLP